MGRLVNYYYVIDSARCNAGFPAAVYLLHSAPLTLAQHDRKRVGDATTVLQAALQPVRANACVMGPRVLGVSNFDVAELSCKGMVMGRKQGIGGRRLRDEKTRAQSSRTATSVACPEICYGIMSGNYSDRNIVPWPGTKCVCNLFLDCVDCRLSCIRYHSF